LDVNLEAWLGFGQLGSPRKRHFFYQVTSFLLLLPFFSRNLLPSRISCSNLEAKKNTPAKMDTRRVRLLLTLVGVAFTIAGFTGMVVYCALLNNVGTTYLVPYFLDIWLTLLTLFYGLQLLWSVNLALPRSPKTATKNFAY